MATGGGDRQLPPHSVCCWHVVPTAFSSRAMGMGTQPDRGWVPLMFRGRPDSSTGRRKHRFLFAMVSQAWFSRGGEQFLSQESAHILEEDVIAL